MATRFFDNRLSRALSRMFAATQEISPQRSATNSYELDEMLRHGDDGVTVGTAMQVAAVFACVRVLSTSQAMLPLALYKREGTRRNLVDDHAVARVLRRPNRWQTPLEFETMMAAHKHLRGNAYAYVSRLGLEVRELIPLNPDSITVEQTSNLDVIYRQRLRNGSERVYSRTDIHHRRGLTMDGLTGLSPIAAAKQAIGLAIQTEKHGGKLFTNAAKPSGVLKSPKPLSVEAAQRLKDSFQDTYGGNDNAYRTIVLEDGLEWQQVGMNATDSQFLESRKFQRNEIAMFYGVPPHMIGDIDRGTSWGSGIEQQGLGFLVHTLQPHLVNDQQALARDLLSEKDSRSHSIVHDPSILTRAQFLTRQQGLEIQLRNGVINPNEWRQIEGLNPRDDEAGDDYAKAQAGGGFGGGYAPDGQGTVDDSGESEVAA